MRNGAVPNSARPITLPQTEHPGLVVLGAQKLKALRRLKTRSGRIAAGQFLVEGPGAVSQALAVHSQAEQVVHQLLLNPAAVAQFQPLLGLARGQGIDVRMLTEHSATELADTVTTQGIFAVCALADRSLQTIVNQIRPGAGTRIAILAQVRDPGNAGTIIRAADATGATGVVLTDSSVDAHNPKSVRATAGSIFHLPVVQGGSLAVTVQELKAAGVVILAADISGRCDLDVLLDQAAVDQGALLNRPTAWIFGNEAWGLPDQDLALADFTVKVPIHGRAESLNLAMAATICLQASARAQTASSRGDVTGQNQGG